MDRKEFIKSAGCLCGVGALAGLIATTESCAPKTQMFKATVASGKALVPTSLFEGGNIQIVKVQGLEDKVAIVKNTDGSYAAFEMKCTHAGATLKVNGDDFACNLHGSLFSTDGQVKKGPAKLPLKNFKTQVVDGNVELQIG